MKHTQKNSISVNPTNHAAKGFKKEMTRTVVWSEAQQRYLVQMVEKKQQQMIEASDDDDFERQSDEVVMNRAGSVIF